MYLPSGETNLDALSLVRGRTADGAETVAIGGVSLPVSTPAAPELVPHVLFYDIPRYVCMCVPTLEGWPACLHNSSFSE